MPGLVLLAFAAFVLRADGLKCFLCDVASASDLASCPQAGASAKSW
jgi:hypothetical protein